MTSESGTVAVNIVANTAPIAAGMEEASTAVEGFAAIANAAMTDVAAATDAAASAISAAMAEIGVVAAAAGEGIASMAVGSVSLTAIQTTALAAAAAIAVLTGATYELTKNEGDLVENARQLQSYFGIDASAAAGLSGALKEIGVSTDAYTATYTRFVRQLKAHADIIAPLIGMTQQQLSAQKDSNVVFQQAISAMSQYQVGNNANQVAMELFGRSISDVIVLQRLHTEAIQEAAARAQELGLVITGQDIAAYVAWQKASADATESLEGIVHAIAQDLLPNLTTLANWFANSGPSSISATHAAIQGLTNDLIQYGYWVMEVEQETDTASLMIVKAMEDSANASTSALGMMIDSTLGLSTATNSLDSQINLSIQATDNLKTSAIGASLSLDAETNSMKAAAIAAIALGNAFIFANNNQLTGVTASGGTKQAPSFKGGGGGGKHDQEMQEDKEYAQFQQQMAQQQLDRDQVTANAEYQMGHITKQQLIADEIDFENQKYQIDLNALQQLAAAQANDPNANAAARQKVLDQMLLLESKHQTAVLKLNEEAAVDSQKFYTDASTSISSAFDTMFQDIVSGQNTLAQSFTNFGNAIAAALAKMSAQIIAENLFGGSGSGGSGGLSGMISMLFGGGGMSGGTSSGGLGSLFGSLFGGGTDAAAAGGGADFSAALGSIAFMASGGPTDSNTPYIVGEQGPELFIPQNAGTIVPNGVTSSSGMNITNNFMIQGNVSQQSQQQIAAAVAQSLSNASKRNN